ncbi:MAG: DUF3313 family protein [Steroidobacteraceae bacterium]
MKILHRLTMPARALFAAMLLMGAASAGADATWPAQSPDGLTLRKTLEHGAVYIKQGVDLSQYKSIGLLECYVQFAKDWVIDYNENEPDLTLQISPDDEKRIASWLSAEFNKDFVEELSKNNDFQIVTQQGPGVLMLRPALINVMITAPDLNSPTPSAEIVTSAGQMTLYLELWDGGSSTLIARVIDGEADPGMGGMGEQANSVTNKAAADEMLKSWADRLRKGLDAIRAAGAQPAAGTPPATN